MARVWAHVHVRHVAIVSRMAHRPNPGLGWFRVAKPITLEGEKGPPAEDELGWSPS